MRTAGDCLISVYPSWHNNANGRLSRFHHSHLHTARVCAKNSIRLTFHKKRVLHITSGMLRREIQSREYMPIVFNLWSVFHTESHALKNGKYFFANQLQRMSASVCPLSVWASEIRNFNVTFIRFELHRTFIYFFLNGSFQSIHYCSHCLFFFVWNGLEGLEQIVQDALST